MNRRLRLVRQYVSGRPVWCSWQVTPRCDSFCVFCEHRAEAALEETDLRGIEAIAADLGRSGSMIVSLSGGDPMQRADLIEIVAAVARWHFPLMTTHGWLATEARARGLWEAGLEAVSVALDYADAARQDARAGLPGAHSRAVAALQAFASTRTKSTQDVNVKALLRADNLAELPALLRLAATEGATVTVEPALPLGADGLSGAGLGEHLRDLRSRHPNLRTSSYVGGRFEQALAGGVPGCQAGRAFFNVDHRGRVSKCALFRKPEDRAGTLGQEPVTTVLSRLRARNERNDCRACWMSSRGEVEGLYTMRGLMAALPSLVRA